MAQPNESSIAPLAYSYASFAQASTISETTLRADAKAGLLRVRKKGTRHIILPEDGQEYLDALPEL